MKKIVAVAFVVGLAIGIFQLFWTYERTKQNVKTISINPTACTAISPECGYCMYEVKDGKCYEPAYTQKFRGFPFNSGSYGVDSRIDITPLLVVNVFIWALGVPTLVFIVIKIIRRLHNSGSRQ